MVVHQGVFLLTSAKVTLFDNFKLFFLPAFVVRGEFPPEPVTSSALVSTVEGRDARVVSPRLESPALEDGLTIESSDWEAGGEKPSMAGHGPIVFSQIDHMAFVG